MSVFETFARLVPPPLYLTLPNIGLDISDTSVKYIRFQPMQQRSHHLELADWGDIEIPSGTLSRGEVKDVAQLAKILRVVKDKTHIDSVRMSLPEERAYLFETEISSGTSFKEIRGLLEFKLEENVPLSPRDAYFDYQIIDSVNENEPLKVVVTAYAKETVDGYYEACQIAGVRPLSFEVEAQAVSRAVLPKDTVGAHMIVDFGKTRTGIGIVNNGILVYTSTIDIGGKELSSALRRQIGERSEAELTSIKNSYGLVRGVADTDAYDALMTTMSAVKDEISLRVQYWNAHTLSSPNQANIQSIILCGGSSNLKGLSSYFTETLGIDTYRAEVWQNAFPLEEMIPPIDQPHSFGYATAIGLALASYTHL